MTDKITKTKERLELYYEAEKAVLLRQSYKIGSRELTMADLDTIRKQIDTEFKTVSIIKCSKLGDNDKKKMMEEKRLKELFL